MTNPLYLIEASFGRKGRAFIETDRDSNSRAHVIELIRSGEVTPVKIIEIVEDEGTCRDVTEEIEQDVASIRILIEVDRAAAAIDHARALRNEVAL